MSSKPKSRDRFSRQRQSFVSPALHGPTGIKDKKARAIYLSSSVYFSSAPNTPMVCTLFGENLKGEVALALRESCSISFSRCQEIHLATEIGISSENREPQGESWPTPGHRIQAEQTAAVKTLSYKFLWQNQLA